MTFTAVPHYLEGRVSVLPSARPSVRLRQDTSHPARFRPFQPFTGGDSPCFAGVVPQAASVATPERRSL